MFLSVWQRTSAVKDVSPLEVTALRMNFSVLTTVCLNSIVRQDKERSGGRGVMGGGGGGGRGFFGFGGGGKSGGARRSRDSHGGAMASGTGGGIDSGGDSHYHGGHYRTHIFMSPLGGRQGEPLLVGGKGGMYAMDEMVPAGGLSSSGAGPLAEQGGRRGGGGGGGSGAAVTLMKWKEAGGGGKRRKPKSGEDPQQHSAQRPRPPTPPLVLPPPVPAGTMLQEDEGRSPYGKQVSFGGGGPGGGGGGGAGTVLSLAALDRDCFIIPVASLDRFLPAGVTLPAGEKKKADGHGGTAPATSPTSPSTVSATFLSVLEVEEPRVVVAAHLMTALRPVRPELESPLEAALTHRTNRQRGAARELLTEVAAGDPRLPAARALLLDNMEDNAHFPFISYYVINKRETDAGEFFRRLRVAALRKFEPRSFHYTAAHTVELFSEVATIARPPFNSLHHHAQFVSTSSATAKASEPSELTSTGSGTGASNQGGKTTGYIISVYKVFEGDDREIFEKNWLYWTGARMLYRYLPKWVELRRITLHKSLSRGDKVYLLLCECANFPDDLSAAALLLPALRARLCGYTGLYRASASL